MTSSHKHSTDQKNADQSHDKATGPDSPEVKPFDDRPQHEDEALSGFVQSKDPESGSRGGKSDTRTSDTGKS